MQNLKKSAKSRGVIVFAFNTTINYVGIADLSSRLIAHNLKLPITLITDMDSDPKFKYDQVIRIAPEHTTNIRGAAGDKQIQWRNFGRYLAYELSPYYETILIDTDYLILDDSLLKLFDTKFDYKLMHNNQTNTGPSTDVMGTTGLPFVWATVVLFRKTERAGMLFNLVGRIQRNYNYYRMVYNISKGNFRNDFAFAIANNILNGYTLNEAQGIPWPLFSIYHNIESITKSGCFLKINHAVIATDKWPLTTIVAQQNIHILDKQYLETNNFKQLVEQLCES